MKSAAARVVLFLGIVYAVAGILFGALAGQAASNQVLPALPAFVVALVAAILFARARGSLS